MASDEQQLFQACLKSASRYFEFGAGGSTVWAAQQGLTVHGIESDAQWVNALKAQLGELCRVEAVDIGPTQAWGFPASKEHEDKFSNYSLAINAHDEPFDLILVDGRFRVACTMAAILHILRHHDRLGEAKIFIHDFWNRPHYHCVLQFLETLEKVNTAGLFKVKENLSPTDVESVWREYAKDPA